MTRSITTVIAVLVLLFAPDENVRAHARLEDSSLAPGAILTAVPASISLTFTEAVDPEFSSASLIAPDRTVVRPVEVAIDPRNDHIATFTILDASTLAPGSYALLWRVVSAVDGHTTTGVLGFSAGTGSTPEIASTSEASGGNWSGSAGRFLELIGLLAIAGSALLATIAGDPARVLRRIVLVALPVAAAGLTVTAFNLFAGATGASFGRWPDGSNALEILTESTPGRALLVRTAAVFVIGILLIPRERREVAAAIALAAAGAIASFSFIGHAAGLRGSAAIGVDLAHLLTSAAWSGGLLLVAITIWRLRNDGSESAIGLVTTFSRIAFVAFLIVGASGLINAWFNVAGPKNLTGTDYGRALILKSVLALLILTAAAVNRTMIVPRLGAGSTPGRTGFWRSLRMSAVVELGLAIAVLLLAARLTSIPPADEPLTVDVASRSGTVEVSGVSGDLSIRFEGEIANEPNGEFRILVIDAETGAAASEIARVIVDARAPDPLDPNADPIQDRFDADPISETPGAFVVPRTRLGLEETWSIEVIVRRLGLEDESLAFDLDLTATAPQPPRLVEEVWRLPRIPWSGYLALAAAAGTVVGALVLIRRLKGLEPVTAGIMLAVAGLITIGFLLSAWRSGPIPVSDGELPAPPGLDDPGAITRATDTWAMQCASCHGVDGGGIGDDEDEQGAHAHPSEAGDLLGPQSQARTPGELYWIISNGLGGTSMPAFDLALTDEERADLVAYLIDLQDQVP